MGVKKLYSRKDFHALLQHISAVFPQQVLHGQVAFLVALGIQSEQAFPHLGLSVEDSGEKKASCLLLYGYITETFHDVIRRATVIDGIAGTFGSWDVFNKDMLLQQVLDITNSSVF